MKHDIESCEWMVDKIRRSHTYAQHLYAAICNNVFQRNDVIPILKGWKWTASWRMAAGIVGDLRGGNYGDFYCTGPNYDHNNTHAVSEGQITDEIRQDLIKLGWIILQGD